MLTPPYFPQQDVHHLHLLRYWPVLQRILPQSDWHPRVRLRSHFAHELTPMGFLLHRVPHQCMAL